MRTQSVTLTMTNSIWWICRKKKVMAHPSSADRLVLLTSIHLWTAEMLWWSWDSYGQQHRVLKKQSKTCTMVRRSNQPSLHQNSFYQQCRKDRRESHHWSSPFRQALNQSLFQAGNSWVEPPAIEPSVSCHLRSNCKSVSSLQFCSAVSSAGFAGSQPPPLGYVWQMICSYAPPEQQYKSQGHSMVLWMTGQSTLWLNLSSLSDLQKAEIMDAACHPSNGLFGPALSALSFSPDQKMSVMSTFKNQEREVFDLCLPDKPQLCPPRPPTVQMSGPAW